MVSDLPLFQPVQEPVSSSQASRLLDVETLYLEAEAEAHPRGQQILARFPHARRVPIASHRDIPELHGDAANLPEWVRRKRDALVLGIRKTTTVRLNGRSADFIAPGISNGCAMACAYCYVARRKGHSNPITVFVNDDQMRTSIARHATRQGRKLEPNQVDPAAWVYDIGENGDISVDATLSGAVRDMVAFFRDELPNAKGSAATKWVNRDMLSYDPRGRTRLRFSVMPEPAAKVLDVRTSPMAERIGAIDDFVAAGYEVHLNFSPVVVYEGYEADYLRLFEEIGDRVGAQAKAQLAAEVIFLTHNRDLHETNLAWHPKAEERFLWRPDIQEEKVSESGQVNLRYRAGFKRDEISGFVAAMKKRLPYCHVRYAF